MTRSTIRSAALPAEGKWRLAHLHQPTWNGERLALARRIGEWRAHQSAGTAPGAHPSATPQPSHIETAQEIDIFAKIERLADLHQKGILSPEEFATKKAELLSRL